MAEGKCDKCGAPTSNRGNMFRCGSGMVDYSSKGAKLVQTTTSVTETRHCVLCDSCINEYAENLKKGKGNYAAPIIGMIGGFDFSGFVVTVNNSPIAVGKFINAVINFLLIALVLFSVIKAINKAASVVKKPEEAPAEPTTKICPYCKSEIAIEATRCPHCTSEL